jgi:hypothetical protein
MCANTTHKCTSCGRGSSFIRRRMPSTARVGMVAVAVARSLALPPTVAFPNPDSRFPLTTHQAHHLTSGAASAGSHAPYPICRPPPLRNTRYPSSTLSTPKTPRSPSRCHKPPSQSPPPPARPPLRAGFPLSASQVRTLSSPPHRPPTPRRSARSPNLVKQQDIRESSDPTSFSRW